MAKGIAFEFLDVGQGDGTLVQMPPYDSGELWLVDFGKKSSSDVPINDALKFLIQRISLVCKTRKPNARIPWVDRLVITHVDGDHWNRLGNLILGITGTRTAPLETDLWYKWGVDSDGHPRWAHNTQLQIGQVVVGGNWNVYKNKDAALAKLIDDAIVEVDPRTGEKLRVSLAPNYYNLPAGPPYYETNGCKVYVLSSSLRPGKGSPNPDSIVMLFNYDNRNVILTGDAESKIAEPTILKRYENDLNFLRSYALKLGHHGSDSSSSQAWLDQVQPKVAFASGDKKWGHPYSGPFARADKYLAKISMGDHRFCASGAGGVSSWWGYITGLGDLTMDYTNRTTTKGECTNLWYVVKGQTEDGETFEPDPPYRRISKTEKYGLYTGVQWRLEINPGLSPHVQCTPQWPLMPGQQPGQ